MSIVQYVLGICAALLTFVVVLEMLRRRRLRERHAGWWLIAGLGAIVISVFPNVLIQLAGWLGFEAPINLVFFASLFILFLVALQHSSELTKLESQNRRLVERLALLELKVNGMSKTESSANRVAAPTRNRKITTDTSNLSEYVLKKR